MGMTDVRLKIKNPQNPLKVYEGKFLVDSGATYTVVPSSVLKDLGIRPQRVESFVLADGSTINRKVGNAFFEFQGRESAAPVLFGEKGDTNLLGVFTLEALGLTLDPLKRTLHKALLRL
ncbi:aspartyl protease family protein [Candidatus Gottesmanbacteria bacterium]|nr:aspartyl protease family protein [Candidatus Gottesmanbacteria bacterium]